MKNKIRNCSSHSSIKVPLCFYYFYSISFFTDPQDPVWPENVFINAAKCWQMFYGLLQIYHYYYIEKLRVDKLASFTLSYKSLTVFVCQYSRTWQTKAFYINSEHIKRINKFRAKCIQKTVSYLNLFTDFNLLPCVLRNRRFVRVNSSVALILHHNFQS